MGYTRQEIAVYEKIRFRAVGGHIFTLCCVGAAFIALKVVGVLDLSWWWVTAPFWASVLHFLATAIHIAALRAGNAREAADG
jgi:hypothetical protein